MPKTSAVLFSVVLFIIMKQRKERKKKEKQLECSFIASVGTVPPLHTHIVCACESVCVVVCVCVRNKVNARNLIKHEL